MSTMTMRTTTINDVEYENEDSNVTNERIKNWARWTGRGKESDAFKKTKKIPNTK